MKIFSDFTHKISWSIFLHAFNRCDSASGRCLFVLLTAHDPFFAVRNDTAPVVVPFEKLLAGPYSTRINRWSRSHVAKKSTNQRLYPRIL